MKMVLIMLLGLMLAGCGDSAFLVEGPHVRIEGQLKDGAKVSTDEARVALQVVVDGIDKP